jgi:hypothetical protein
MNIKLAEALDKRVVSILAGAVVLILMAAIATVSFRAATPQISAEMQHAPVDTGDASEESANPAPDIDVSGLERELKEAWRAQIVIQSYQNAVQTASEPGRDLLEQDLKEAWRARLSEESGPDLLERALKEAWRAQLLAAGEE